MWAIYRSWTSYVPVRRGGKPVAFKTKNAAKKWLKENPPATSVPGTEFTVRKLVKHNIN